MRGRHIFAAGSFVGVGAALAIAAGCGDRMTTITEFVEGGPPQPTEIVPPAPVRPPPTGTTTSVPPPMFGCPSTTPIDPSGFPYAPPTAPEAACTDADIALLEMDLPSASNDDPLKALLTPSCAACAFTDGLALRWGPIPETMSADGGSIPMTVNLGGCWAIVTGSQACGQARQSLHDCEQAACADCPLGDSSAFAACVSSATSFSGVCEPELSAYQASCLTLDASASAAAVTSCEPPIGPDFDGPVRVMCMAHADGGDGGDGGDAGDGSDAGDGGDGGDGG